MSATHACSEALQGNGLRPGLKPFGEEDETLRRCDYHRGDTQLLICVRNPQQIHRAEPLSNYQRECPAADQGYSEEETLLRLRARLLHYRSG